MKKKTNNKQSGFTLVEILVATAIFSSFMVVAVDSFINILNVENKTNVLRKTQEDTSGILESIMREARSANGVFDASGKRVEPAYSVASNSLTIKSTENSTVTETVYSLDTNGILSRTQSKMLIGYGYGSPTTDPLNDMSSVKINVFTPSIIWPPNCNGSNSSNPATKDYYINCPPMLKVEINSENGEGARNDKQAFTAKVDLQSSATPRNY